MPSYYFCCNGDLPTDNGLLIAEAVRIFEAQSPALKFSKILFLTGRGHHSSYQNRHHQNHVYYILQPAILWNIWVASIIIFSAHS